jgi:hypothetical protein
MKGDISMFPRSILISLILTNNLFSADKGVTNPILVDQLPDLELGLFHNDQKSQLPLTTTTSTTPRPRTRSNGNGAGEYNMVRRSSRANKIPRAMRTALSQLPQDSQERLTDLLLRQSSTIPATTPHAVSDELRTLNAVMADSVKLQSECLTRQQEITRLQEARLTEMTKATTKAKQIAMAGAAFTAIYGTASFIIENLDAIKALTGW